jgi:multidrug efflux system outer membrane protein
MSKYLGILVLLLLTPSCLIKHSCRPHVAVPQNWRLSDEEAKPIVNGPWWEQFEDSALNEIISITVDHNYDLLAAAARVDEFYDNLHAVRSQLYPFIDGNASATRQQVSMATCATQALMSQIPEGQGLSPICRISTDYLMTLNLSYEVDLWGRVHYAVKEALEQWLTQVEARRALVLTIVRTVSSAYIQLRQFDQQLVISQDTYESRMKSFKLAELRYKEGLTSDLEVEQAASQVQVALIQVKEFERMIPQQENLISILLGMLPGNITRGETLASMHLPPEIPAGLPSELLCRRPDILQAQHQLQAAGAAVGQAIAAYFPNITLTGMLGSESSTLRQLLTSPASIWQYGINIMEPIFNAGKTSAQVAQAKAVEEQALYNYFNVILNAFREVEDALIANRKNRELVDVHQKQVEVLKKYLHLATLQYENGQTDYLNVLDAERTLFDAQLDLVNAEAESFLSIIQLYSALGGGW